ncbi:FhaA domain-containing protein [Gephyromycinifex aptenodytis]|uniref:FhaA domain-containing protein n=1 Tax=Gephyromycinifex aptenodytis TaxID=2716227 RepID=UPI001D025CB0|nr:DUF3662 and FHA domain-containing protein [Gephyromycinifex aptenodytis]
MGLFDRVEKKLERVVNGVFARAFKAEVQPVEIASAMRRAMDERAAVIGKTRIVVPNVFTIELASDDYDRLVQYNDMLVTELTASVQEHADSQGYTPGGPIAVEFSNSSDLETGVFRVRPSTATNPRLGKSGYRPRNEPFTPQASAPAEGNVGLAGHAAAAAAGAVAGTAAAGRAHAWAQDQPEVPGYPPVKPKSQQPASSGGSYRPPVSSPEERERNVQRQRDLAAWPEDDEPAGFAPDEPMAPQQAAPDLPARPAPAPQPQVAATPPPRPRTPRPWLELGQDSYPLHAAITILGRDHSADITLDDPGISRRHCEIRVTYDGPHLVASIRDLGSTNGTFVNGERITTARLDEGDRVTLGRTSLVTHFGER